MTNDGGDSMNRDSERLRSLYQRLNSGRLTRAERKDIMEEIKREKYRLDTRKPISQKGQAVCNVIYGALLTVTPIVSKITHAGADKGYRSFADAFFIATLVIVFVIAAMTYSRKAEPADELCKELMLKATGWSAPILISVVWLAGLIMTIVGNNSEEGVYAVTSDDMALLVILLTGVYMTSRNAIYLWLDRTPAADDEED